MVLISVFTVCLANAESLNLQEKINIRADIVQLAHDYGFYRDELDLVGYANIFTKDGVFKFHGDIYQGHDVLQQRIKDANKATVSMHMITSSKINIIDENNATGVHYAVVYSNARDESHEEGTVIAVKGPVTIGQYQDSYLRTEEGWKISERGFKALFNTPK